MQQPLYLVLFRPPNSEMSTGRLKKNNKLSANGQISLDPPPPHHQINNDIFVT